MALDRLLSAYLSRLQARALFAKGVEQFCCPAKTPCFYKPTVCPSDDSAHMLSDQELLTSIQWWRGHGQEAHRGEAGGARITRHVKRLGRFSRVRPPGCPCLRGGA